MCKSVDDEEEDLQVVEYLASAFSAEEPSGNSIAGSIFTMGMLIQDLIYEYDRIKNGLWVIARKPDIEFQSLYGMKSDEVSVETKAQAEHVNPWLISSINFALKQIYDPQALAIINELAHSIALEQ